MAWNGVCKFMIVSASFFYRTLVLFMQACACVALSCWQVKDSRQVNTRRFLGPVVYRKIVLRAGKQLACLPGYISHPRRFTRSLHTALPALSSASRLAPGMNGCVFLSVLRPARRSCNTPPSFEPPRGNLRAKKGRVRRAFYMPLIWRSFAGAIFFSPL